MASKNTHSEGLDNFNEEQIANLGSSIEQLDKEDKMWFQDLENEHEGQRVKPKSNKLFYRLRKSPIEIINRLLFFFFLGSLFFSFVTVYASSVWWFVAYVVSAFSCIIYSPNRKALKELIAAWPNIEDLIRKKSLWRK